MSPPRPAGGGAQSVQGVPPLKAVPEQRIQAANEAGVREAGEWILYWMIAQRRAGWNFGLQRALELAESLDRPVVVLEALRCGYPWASDRLHRYVLDGMAANARRFEGTGVHYYPYVEPHAGDGRGLLDALGRRASVVVTDEFPAFILPRMVRGAARRLPVRVEQVDSNGLLPMRATNRVYATAHSFRRFLQKNLPAHFGEFPEADPLEEADVPECPELPGGILRRWPETATDELEGGREVLRRLDIDHTVPPAPDTGGADAATARLREFLTEDLPRYAKDRNRPEEAVTSRLSGYLHFGHLSPHQVFRELMDAEGWSPDDVSSETKGSRTGWWRVGENAEAFLDQLVTWRELGFNMAWQRRDANRYGSLPAWALKTLREHEGDPREHVYTLAEFEAASTHDPLWNAAQMQLVREGRIHNYLRMLWGKKILEWSRTPRDAAAVMIELNNKYALDGRDPNSNSGIFWVLGRYDRAWGPERPVFGKVRYMSSENTARKVRVQGYIQKYAP